MCGIDRYFLQLAYDGGGFSGWQIQPNAESVQAVLQRALSKLLSAPIAITGSGRTDAGVHALSQFAHFDSPKPIIDKQNFVYRLNSMLPDSIVVARLWLVHADAHARFDAQIRKYEYHFHTQDSPFNQKFSVLINKQINKLAMHSCGLLMLQNTDFACFCKKGSDINNTNCRIYESVWQFDNPEKIIFRIAANRFLRGMVRATVGAMLEVGLGRLSIGDFAELLESKNHAICPKAAPAKGLFLSDVSYLEGVLLD